MLFCLAGWVVLQVQAAQADTMYLYNITTDQYGDGSYVEYSPAVVNPGNVISSGSLAVLGGGANLGLSYQLPYPVNTNPVVSNGWLGIYGVDGTTENNLVNFQANGDMTIYSNGNDAGGGGLAYVTAPVWASVVPNWDGYTSKENATGAPAFYSTNGDGGAVPGNPSPHPTIEANYYFNTLPVTVPEPTSVALAFAGLAVGMLLMLRRRLA